MPRGKSTLRTLWVGKRGPNGESALVGREYRVMIDDAAIRAMIARAANSKTGRAVRGPLTVAFDKAGNSLDKKQHDV